MNARRGFTLVEALVAVVLAAGVVGTAHALVGAVGDAASRVAMAAATEDELAGGELLARTIVRQARVLTGDSVSLLGTSRGFVIESWCPVPGGWSERCTAAFVIDDSSLLLLLRPGKAGRFARVARGREPIALRYLASAADGGRWVDRWSSSDLPFAIGIVVDGNTLILPAGR